MAKTEEQRKKELAILKATNELLAESKEETLLRGHKDEAELIEKASLENKSKLKLLGADEKDLENIQYKEPSSEEVAKFERYCKNRGIDPNSVYNKSLVNTVESSASSISTIEQSNLVESIITPEETEYNLEVSDEYSDDIQYDVLPLPSNGETYSHKKNRLPVSFLTASDEDFITSPNLYRDGKIIDVLLKRKIMDKTIDPNSLCKGDRDAIILWLRATGYGPEFPITVHDPELDTEYETVIDLTKIEIKPFTLKGDANGNFDYQTKSGNLIKFKFLNHYDELRLIEMSREDNLNVKRFRLNRIVEELKTELKNDKVLSLNDRNKLSASIGTIDSWSKNIKTKNIVEQERAITNTMLLSIVAVNGNSDKDYIKKYVNTMPAREAFDFRKYIIQNEPGMNFEITVNRPENLGGGSFKTFLNIDTSIFINIA
jgi:hypothetical protein